MTPEKHLRRNII